MIASAADAQTAAAADTEAAAATHTEATAYAEAATDTESAGTSPEIDAAANRSADRRKLRRPSLHTIIDIEAQRRLHRRRPTAARATTRG